MGMSLEVTMSPAFAVAIAAVVLAPQPVPAEEPTPALRHLADWLTGSFANAAQATAATLE
jgi:hypothetical protein